MTKLTTALGKRIQNRSYPSILAAFNDNTSHAGPWGELHVVQNLSLPLPRPGTEMPDFVALVIYRFGFRHSATHFSSLGINES